MEDHRWWVIPCREVQFLSWLLGIIDENELPAVMLADLTAYSEVETLGSGSSTPLSFKKTKKSILNQ
jgi:hypothetical protein